MSPTHVPTPDDYPTWINDRIRAELKRLRLELGLSAFNAVGTLDTPFADPDADSMRLRFNELVLALRR